MAKNAPYKPIEKTDFGKKISGPVAWMDDRSAPSVHVRHNVEGLSLIFPPAYLLSFVVDDESEPIHDGSALARYFRSRMTGVPSAAPLSSYATSRLGVRTCRTAVNCDSPR